MEKKNDLLKLAESGNLQKNVPLYANRGVSKHNSSKNSSFNMCVDWLTLSFNYSFDTYRALFKFLGINPDIYVEQIGTFYVQYKFMRVYRNIIKVYLPDNYAEDPFARCCLELSGQACRLLEKINDNNYFWCALCCMVHSMQGRCSRCDLAIDDFEGKYFSMLDLFNKVYKGEYTCNSQVWNVIVKGRRNEDNESNAGFTIYLGSDSSERQLCSYNKKCERKNNGYETFVDYWVRHELRFKSSTANILFNEYLIQADFWQDFASNVSKLFLGFVDFKEKMDLDNSHRSMEKSWQPWLDFLGVVSKIKIKNQDKLESEIVVKKSWYQENYSNFMNEIALADIKGFDKYMDDTLLKRLNDFDFDIKRLDRINNYRLANGQGDLTSLEFFSYINSLRIKNGYSELSDDDKYIWKCKLFPNELEVEI